MPVALIARKAGCVEALHRADFSGTSPATSRSKRGRATKPMAERPRSSSMSSIARKPKATFARGIDKFVLASLAFEIALDLRLSGLPNIDYRFAFQHRSG